MRIAITGATGSLGGALIARLAAGPGHDLTRVVSLSRDEVKSGDLEEVWGQRLPQLRCQLGDVRDQERLEEVFRGCDVVIHAAALKRVTHSVNSPREMVKTNEQGTMNVIKAAVEVGVERVVVVSSDKAVEPTNLYGKTKAVAEDYAVQSNSDVLPRGTRVSCVRYGNVLGSRGSIVHIWRKQLAAGAPLTVTHPQMTRFIISLSDAARFVLDSVDRMEGGEIFVPILPAAHMHTLADAVSKDWCDSHGLPLDGPSADRAFRRAVIGLREGGEKLHESLLSREEPARTWLVEDGVAAVIPTYHSWREKWDMSAYQRVHAPYTSDCPNRWLGDPDLSAMLKEVL